MRGLRRRRQWKTSIKSIQKLLLPQSVWGHCMRMELAGRKQRHQNERIAANRQENTNKQTRRVPPRTTGKIVNWNGHRCFVFLVCAKALALAKIYIHAWLQRTHNESHVICSAVGSVPLCGNNFVKYETKVHVHFYHQPKTRVEEYTSGVGKHTEERDRETERER